MIEKRTCMNAPTPRLNVEAEPFIAYGPDDHDSLYIPLESELLPDSGWVDV
jgi:hypothetical protein